ncbi:MAG TPA: RnfABCDGE type electron transport complex subunit G [Dysgonamonadaceae bacterium]|jgi:electron transport complex protein RnfG|nr:RnfABCDGE type electron transport complex subunit G [Dysgonamonadaceae bacterium]
MAKLKSTFKNMFLSLFTICFVVAVLLAQVNKITAKPIAEAKAKKLENAIREVVPPFDNDPVAEAYKIPDGAGDSLTVYPAKKGDEWVGFAVTSYSNNAFGGNIQIIVGFDKDNRIVNYSVLSHAETPGLGAKVVQWFKDTSKPGQCIIGRDLSKEKLSVTKDGGNVDAITASTITSRAFLEAVNKAYAAYANALAGDAASGATAATDKSIDSNTTINKNDKTTGGEDHAQ